LLLGRRPNQPSSAWTTSSPIARLDVSPGDSIPIKLTTPASP